MDLSKLEIATIGDWIRFREEFRQNKSLVRNTWSSPSHFISLYEKKNMRTSKSGMSCFSLPVQKQNRKKGGNTFRLFPVLFYQIFGRHLKYLYIEAISLNYQAGHSPKTTAKGHTFCKVWFSIWMVCVCIFLCKFMHFKCKRETKDENRSD